ncbi:hypothetical protein JKF63_07145 [Porcisia hertigi]|uniref:Uncharacterized protein n=1 Tax=Porcisia hertigi TaxID=2761500 RepID=A0A837A959_9TRYP|nr:hypothetical protein JKF63_07145 [Porcisia hertigi]
MSFKHPRRADLPSQRGASHNGSDEDPIVETLATQQGHGGHSPTSFSSPGSLWLRVACDFASWSRGTISIHEVDSWLRFNPYIRRGFRRRFLRKREALGSLVLYLHNETFNIFSHLAMVVVLVLLLLWPPRALVLGGGSGAADPYHGTGEGSGAAIGQHTPAHSLVHPFHRTGMEVPPWLRGRAEAHSATAADGSEETIKGYVPPVDGAASPRHVPNDVAGGTAAPCSGFRLFTFLPSGWAPPPLPPMSVTARLSLSLTPLLVAFLFTFSMSVVYHVFMPCCRSRRGYQQLLQCDVTGVVISIAGSAYTYFTCGMPCVNGSLQMWVGALMAASTLLCLYVLVFRSMCGVLAECCTLVLHLLQWVAAVVMTAALEFLMGRPLGAVPSSSEHHAGQRFLLAWLQRHRHFSSVQCAGASKTSTNVEPTHVSPVQRVVVLGGYSFLHLCVYMLFVYPKSQPAMGGFTQATHHHNASYVWLFLGGLANATRFPEAVVFHWTRSAARHNRRIAAAEAAAWCAERLRRDAAAMTGEDAQKTARGTAAAVPSLPGSGGRPPRDASVGVVPERPAQTNSASPPLLPSVAAPTWWDSLSVPKFLVTYIVSAPTLDYIGNSHNIWHICSTLSAVSAILAVYHDCMEYDLVQCGG